MSNFFLIILLSLSFTFAQAETIEKTTTQLCSALDQAFQKRKWGKSSCSLAGDQTIWKVGGTSIKGRPLMYAVFGNENATNTTLILSMVHGDEITPLYLGFQIAAWAKENMTKNADAKLIIAPLVNPDGFMGYPKTRTNARGVDCNRNFETKDWYKDALKAWKNKFHSNKRRFPGHKPNSEPETLFQKMLIDQYNPKKIVSIHSPLNIIDYDGPDHLKLHAFSNEYIQKCEELRKKVKASSSGFFPGSLGNYTGQELGIPTITLELPTARAEKAVEYWNQLKKGILTVVTYVVPPKEKE
jgi:protein MpaA